MGRIASGASGRYGSDAHIAEIEPNLETLRPKISDDDYWKLKLLIRTHDSFKAETQADVPICDP